MADEQLDLPAPTAPKDVITTVTASPAMMFTQEALPDLLFAHIERTIKTFDYDLSTGVGRAAIKSLAYTVAQTKTAVDAAGAALNEDANKKIKAVNKQRGAFKTRLQELQDLARKPLDEWEAKQAEREAKAQTLIEELKVAGTIALGETAAAVRTRYQTLKGMELNAEFLGEFHMIAKHTLDASLSALGGAYQTLVKAEADAAELKRLQEAEAVRQAEADRIAGENAAWDAMVEEAEAENARYVSAAERAASAARAEADAAAAATLAASQAETKRLQDAETQRKADAALEVAGKATRAANEEHRGKVIDAAATALLDLTGMSKAAAKKLALNIAAGLVPGVKMEF